MTIPPLNERFILGTVTAIGEATQLSEEELLSWLTRHSSFDWGEFNETSVDLENCEAILSDGKVCSVYITAAGRPLYITTDISNSATLVLYADEY